MFRRLADGDMTADEFAAVEERLLADSGFRERYVRAMGIEAGLHEALRFPGTFQLPKPRRLSSVRVFVFGSVCSMLLLGLAVWAYWAFVPGRSGVIYHASASPGAKPVAIVTRAEAASDDVRPGMRIKPGVLLVGEGQLQLEFMNGAQINLEGPAELHILSVEAAKLISGKAAVRIPPGARGFILNTPDAAVVDLGTEFAVSVEKNGESEIHVVDGEVDVSLLGSDGNTLTNQRVTQTGAYRLSGWPLSFKRIDSPSVPLPGIQAQDSSPLRVRDSYVQSVLASQPDIYWRFEQLVDGQVPNEVGERWAGKIHTVAEDSSAIIIRDGVAWFTPSDHPHRLEADEPIQGFNRDSFTIELWVSPDSFHWATLAAVVPIEAPHLHLSLFELPYKCGLVYTPGSFRFLHRHPPGKHGGTNVFTNGDCTPGQWHHLVAVKTPAGIKLYLNGELIRDIVAAAASDDSLYRLYVGQLHIEGTDRQLSGAIDEYAVYLRELSSEEIRGHYRAMILEQNTAQ
ncbi:LamG-like jellyroll fold domain-containing protein [Symmachiella dynata]|nr:LamG-like jellyroll fold domain-containing protein [Symmachiella dynata]